MVLYNYSNNDYLMIFVLKKNLDLVRIFCLNMNVKLNNFKIEFIVIDFNGLFLFIWEK